MVHPVQYTVHHRIRSGKTAGKERAMTYAWFPMIMVYNYLAFKAGSRSTWFCG